MLVCSANYLFAQMDGKRFISGTAGINFNNYNPNVANATNGYGYNFNIAVGKFKTNTKAVGWNLTSSLSGGKTNYTILSEVNLPIDIQRNGINSVGVGVGRFWQYYKHFNNKTGIFAGPHINLSFSNSKTYERGAEAKYLSETKTNAIQVSAGLTAGAYYHFSDKWWITASLAFSNPVSVNYSFISKSDSPANITDENKSTQLNYTFAPRFTFPNVGIGLRYFL